MKKPIAKSVPSRPVAETRPVSADGNKQVFLAAIICAVVAFLLYAGTIGHDYTVDDGTVISENKITKKGISALPEIFSTPYRAGFWDRNEGLYRPLSVAMFAIEWEIAPENPMPGHIINVLLYAATAFLMLIWLARLFKSFSILLPLTATLLFVVHPIHTEVVANIKSRDEILCVFFVLLTFLSIDKYFESGKILKLILAAVMFFLAFLSKESAITIVGVIPFYIWFFHSKPFRQLINVSLVFAGVAAVNMTLRFLALGELKGSPLLQLVNNSLLGTESGIDRFATAMYVMGKYLYLLIIPHPLAFDYSYNTIPVVSLSHPLALLSIAVFGFLAWFAFKGIKSRNPVAFWVLFSFATISLVSNVLFLIESTMAERFLYMPSIGFAVAVAYLALKYTGLLHTGHGLSLNSLLRLKPVFTISATIILALYSFKTVSRSTDWKNNLTLLSRDVKTCPESARIRYAYGSALLIEKALKEENEYEKMSLLDQSIVQLSKGVSILPNYAEAWNHLGIAYKERKNFPAAVNAFEKARSFKKFTDADFFIASGLAYGETKKYDLAIADFTTAISINPSNPEAYNNKGLYLFESGKADSSIFYFDKAIALKPDFYQAFYNKGNTVAAAGRYQEAIALYGEALKHKPGYPDALLNIGNSYAALRDYNNAIKYFDMVLQAEPGNKKALINIGITYRILGDEAKATEYFRRSEQPAGGAR